MLRPPRGVLTSRHKVLFISLAALLVLSLLYSRSSYRSSRPPLPHPLISLTSTPQRVNTTLGPTLWSLVRQSHPPSAIRVHLPLSEDGIAPTSLPSSDAVYRHPLVQIVYVEDEGPATKFYPSIRAAFELAKAENDLSPLLSPIVVVDDDHLYSPVLVETLVRAWEERGREAAVALRGWRVRRDLRWGVGGGWEEVRRHVVEGWRVSRGYRVGVITANEGYLITPSFFLSPSLRFSSFSLSSSLSPSQKLSLLPSPSSLPFFFPPSSSAPESLHLVDDILLSGSLAQSLIPRFVVPLCAEPGPPSVDITPPSRTEEEKAGGPRSPLEHHLAEHGKSRGEANDEALAYFGAAFAAERDDEGGEGSLWYDMRSVEERRADGNRGEPQWKGWAGRTWSEVSKWAFYTRARRVWGGQRVVWN
ncbi:hypothetical protein JCM8547_003421 [Rhodosporidiobolus lusitaniae]